MTLSLLCISKGEPHADYFLGQLERAAEILESELVIAFDVSDGGCIEYALDEGVAMCSGDYVLRIDDDETISEEMLAWLYTCEYMKADVWSFPRKHLWGEGYLSNSPLYPDLQTRLTVKEKAGGRKQVHEGSPFGAGRVADVHILHHKFLVKGFEQRKVLANQYDVLRPGAGTGQWLAFNLPEEAFEDLEVRL